MREANSSVLIVAAGSVALAAPIVLGLLHAPQVRAQSQQTAAKASPVFDVASIKPNKSGTDFAKILFTRSGMSVENLTVHRLIYQAYEVQDNQIIGEPGWLNSDKYDIEAKVDPALAGPGYAPSDRKLALQQLLIDRCKLQLHRETRELPVYELVIARDGPRIKQSKPGDLYADGVKGPTGRPIGPGLWSQGRGNRASQGMELKYLLSILSRNMDRPILDKTGLTGKYDYTLQWDPEEGAAPGGDQAAAVQPSPLPESSGPSIFVALREQLGLKLEAKKGPVEVLVIDHVEKPSEN